MKSIVEEFELEFDGISGCTLMHKSEVEKIQTDVSALHAENAKLRGLLQNIVEAHNSPAASGGEMWYAEAMSDAVEKVIAALAETQINNL